MADRVGQQFGNYRLVALLGQGGYAKVYLGQHVRLELQAAIKVLHTHLTRSQEPLSRRWSARNAARCERFILREGRRGFLPMQSD